MKESGYPDFVSHVWSSIMVRSETPDAIVDKLHEAFKAAMAEPGRPRITRRRARRSRKHAPPREMQAFVVSEYERFKTVAKAAGIAPR